MTANARPGAGNSGAQNVDPGILLHLGGEEILVIPGTNAVFDIQVRNSGAVVEQVDLAALGDAAPWTRIDPPRLSLYPQAQASARVTIALPRSHATRAGSWPFGIRASSHRSPEAGTVQELNLSVAPFTSITAELVPRTSHAPRAGRHELAVDNRGNTSADLHLLPLDPDELLEFLLTTDALTAAPGTTSFVRMRVRC